MSTRGPARAALLLLLAAGAWGCAADAVPMAAGRATVSLSEPERFYAAGDPVLFQVSVFNRSQQALLADADLWGGSRFLLDDGSPQAHQPQPVDPGEPVRLEVGQRTARDLDMVSIFPALARPGSYQLTVVFPDYRSNTVAIVIIPAYDTGASYHAEVRTDHGPFTLGFFPDVAPNHVRNFVGLARSGYYDGNIVHRIMPGMMIQSGDPTSSGRGGPGWTLKAEFNEKPHRRGTLSMARQASDPDSAGGQWFICLDSVPQWDGQYTVFGEVIAGMETVERIGRIPVEDEVPEEVVTIETIVIRDGAGDPGDGSP